MTASAGKQPERAATLNFLGLGDPDHVHAWSAYYVRSSQVLRLLTRQLFAYPAAAQVSDPTQVFTPVPDVAVELPTTSNGGLDAERRVYTIRLRKGVLWDTTPPRAVTAQDFIRGFKRIAHPAVGAGARDYFTSTIAGMDEYCAAYEQAFQEGPLTAAAAAEFAAAHPVAGLSAIDDTTLKITLLSPANDFINILAMGVASAAPLEYDQLLPDSDEFRRQMRSNGPYRIAGFSSDGHEMLLEPNPVWRQETDAIRRRELDSICIGMRDQPEDVILRKIEAREVDLAWPLAVVSWSGPNPARDTFPHSYPAFTINPYLVFNLNSPNQRGAMASLGVRQAIAYAVNKVAIREIFDELDGVASSPLHSIIAPGNVGYREFNLYPTPDDRGDPVKARELLIAAGHGNGLELRTAVRQIDLHIAVMNSIARDLADIGIELQLRYYSQAEYYGQLLCEPAKGRAGLWDIAEAGWAPDWWGNNGRAIIQPLFQTNNNSGTTNFGCYSNPVIDRLIDQALQEAVPVQAEELWNQINLQVMKDLPIVPLLAFGCRCCVARSGAAGWGTGSTRAHHWLQRPGDSGPEPADRVPSTSKS